MDTSSSRDFQVGDWLVRPQLNRIEQGERVVHLEPRSVDVLCCLARSAPKVVSKERLIEAVWGETFVGEEVVSHAVWELRRAFDDDARDPRYIRTVPKKGYGVVAPVSFEVVDAPFEAGYTVGHYRLLEKLGGGAMGVVYKAFDTRLEREVAIKFLPPELTRDSEARRRFLREARAAAALDHPHLGVVHEIGETDDGRLFIVMTCYDGETLRAKLRQGPLPVDEAVELGRQVAAGLARAHREGIVHRDVKPANVMVTGEGVAKLVDFGLAKLLGAATLTRAGSSFGTPAYKSPEQSRGEDVDQRTDVWALGVVLYEMLAGHPPFRGDYEQAIVRSILEDEPPPLSGVPVELARIVGRALAKDRDRRHADAGELQADLERLVAGGPVAEPARRRPRKTVLAVVAVAALAALTVVLERGGVLAPTESPAASEVRKYLDQGRTYERRGDARENLEQAELLYRRALELDASDPEVAGTLAVLLARLQRQYPTPERAEEIRRLADGALATRPDTAVAWVALARLHALEGDTAAAVASARRAVETGGDDYAGYAALGEALIAQGQVDEGLAELRRGVEVGEGYIWARLTLARRLMLLRRYNEAGAEYEKVLAYDPNLLNALNGLGLVYYRTGRDRDALPIFRRILELHDDDRVATNLGNIYFRLGRMGEAIAAYRRAHEIAPENPNPLRNLGEAHERIGDAEAARGWYEEALVRYDARLEAGASRARTLALRAVCAAKLGRFDEARSDVGVALGLEPGDRDLLLFAAQVHALAGDAQEVYRFTAEALAAGASREEFQNELFFGAFAQDPRFKGLLEERLER